MGTVGLWAGAEDLRYVGIHYIYLQSVFAAWLTVQETPWQCFLLPVAHQWRKIQSAISSESGSRPIKWIHQHTNALHCGMWWWLIWAAFLVFTLTLPTIARHNHKMAINVRRKWFDWPTCMFGELPRRPSSVGAPSSMVAVIAWKNYTWRTLTTFKAWLLQLTWGGNLCTLLACVHKSPCSTHSGIHVSFETPKLNRVWCSKSMLTRTSNCRSWQ